MPLISPSALLHAHLSQSPPTRPSSRSPTDCRPINLNISSLAHANGSSLVRIGETSIVCGVRAEILPIHEIANYRIASSLTQSTPSNDDEDEDQTCSEITSNHLLVPNLELSTGCSPNHIPGGPPSTEAQSLSQRLLSLLHTSKIVRTSDLKIYYNPPPDAQSREEEEEHKGPHLKAYWTLYIDLLCISYGGSIFDAAWLALYAALQDTLLPRAQWDADLAHVLCSPDIKEARSLRLRGCPVPLSFGVFVPAKPTKKVEGERWILCDTDTFEEECCEETGTITVDSGEDRVEIIRVEKSGGTGVGIAEMRQLCELAKRRRHEWQSTVSGAALDVP